MYVGTSCLRKPLPAPLTPTSRRVREGKELGFGFGVFLKGFMFKNAPKVPSWGPKRLLSEELYGLLHTGAVQHGSCCYGLRRRLFLWILLTGPPQIPSGI